MANSEPRYAWVQGPEIPWPAGTIHGVENPPKRYSLRLQRMDAPECPHCSGAATTATTEPRAEECCAAHRPQGDGRMGGREL